MDTHYLDEVLKGNINAFSHFIDSYQNKAFAVAISIVKNEEMAKDIVQESFIIAYHSIKKFKKASKFSTWLYRIVVNASLQHIKKEKRVQEVLENYYDNTNNLSIVNEALANLSKDELRKIIKDTFTKIPGKEALIIQLFYLEELKINEIEIITGFTKSNIKVLLHRGRTNFFKNFNNNNGPR